MAPFVLFYPPMTERRMDGSFKFDGQGRITDPWIYDERVWPL